jgi:3-dehydroquinate dehydratase-1
MDFEEFVLAAATGDLADEPAAREHADAVEFRMDHAADPLGDLRDYDGTLPVIATNRIAREGGETPDTPGRLETLETAIEQPAVAAVDVELDAIRDGDAGRVLDHASAHGVAVVVSAHDFEGTPDRVRMEALLGAACERGDVGKLAVTAHSLDETLDLLAATRAVAGSGSRVATMAMGELGRHSRAVAPVYGSCIGYAPVDPAEATAPGQYDLETLAGLIEGLGVV